MKILLLFLVSLFLVIGSHAQDTIVAKNSRDTIVSKNSQEAFFVLKDTSAVKKAVKISKFYYGGYINLTFGSYTAIGIEPLIAYKITPKLSTGAILTYEYISDNSTPGYTYNSSNYGASIFTRYRVIPQVYIHAEFSEMKYDSNNSNGYDSRYWVPFLLLGGGFSQQISENAWLNTQILFDVIQNEYSPYSPGVPFYSIGFGVGF
jgi:hypothetical protein